MKNKRLLIFHPTIAPYRIDFFNDLYGAFETRICLEYWNLKDQKFDYSRIYSRFSFEPQYIPCHHVLGLFNFIKKLIKDFNPDIVLVNEFHYITIIVLLLRLFLKRSYKVVCICDDSYNMVAEGNDFSLGHKLGRKLLVPFLDDLILVEPNTVGWYQQHYGKGLYFPIIKNEEIARKEYEIVLPLSKKTIIDCKINGKCVYLFVGRLVDIKNVKTVINAFSMLPQGENILVVVGDGPEKENLMNLAQELHSNVIFTGRLEGENLYQWYNIADIFVLASYLEPFGAVTNEALLAGCYSLISKKAGSQCLIVDNVNGFTFSPNNVQELFNKMVAVRDKLSFGHQLVSIKKSLMLIDYKVIMSKLISTLQSM